MKRSIALSALLAATLLAGCQAPVSPIAATGGAYQAAQGAVRVAIGSASERRVQYAIGDVDRYVVRLVKDGAEIASYDGDGSDVLFNHVPLGEVAVKVMAYQGQTALNRNGEEASATVTVSNGQTATATVDLYLATTPTGNVATDVVVHDADDPAPGISTDPVLDQSQLVSGWNWGVYFDDIMGMGESGHALQSFTAGQNGSLATASFYVASASGAYPTAVKVYAGGTPDSSSAQLLATSAVVDAPTTAGWVDYTFATPASLTAGQVYYLDFGYPNTSDMHYQSVHLGRSDTDVYAGGQAWYANYGSLYQQLSSGNGIVDFAFKTFIQPSTSQSL